MIHRALCTLAALMLAGCGDSERTITVTRIDDAPPGAGARFPMLAADASGRVVMSWTEPAADASTAVRFAVRGADGAWAPAQTLIRDTSLLMNWADFGFVVPAAQGRLVGQWLRKGTARHAYELVLAQSADGGATWSEPVIPHGRARAGEHGFVSAFATADGVAIQYLDGTHNPDSVRAMTLRHIVFDTTGRVATALPLDVRVCDCCQTDAALTAAGPVVVYRDRSDDEVRDISIVRRVDSGWTAPARVHADDWQLDGCPVNGPAVAADGNIAAVAWFTAARDTARVRLARSSDAGATFGPPVEIAAGPEVVGRVDVALLPSGDALVVWLHRSSRERADIRAVAVNPSGAVIWSTSLGSTDAGRPSGFPRAVRSGDAVLVAWTETAGAAAETRVALASIATR
jgi:hypothetical protein